MEIKKDQKQNLVTQPGLSAVDWQPVSTGHQVLEIRVNHGSDSGGQEDSHCQR